MQGTMGGWWSQADVKGLAHVELGRDVVVVDVADADAGVIVPGTGRGVLGEVEGVPEKSAALHRKPSAVEPPNDRGGVPDADPFARLDRDAQEAVRGEDEGDRRGAPV